MPDNTMQVNSRDGMKGLRADSARTFRRSALTVRVENRIPRPFSGRTGARMRLHREPR